MYCFAYNYFFFTYRSSIHIKLHVPQIIKKHTHTRTIFKHHFIKPKHGKSLSHSSPILASPSTSLKHNHPANLLKALPTFDTEDIHLDIANNLWRPSPAEYRASELNFVPKKMKINKKKNPFKMFEAMAEAQAEGHEIRPQFLKKVKHHQQPLDSEDSQTSEYIPDYMLVDNSRFGQGEVFQSDEDNAGLTNGAKSDLLYLTSDDKFIKPKPTKSFLPSIDFIAPTAASKRKPKLTFDWSPGSTLGYTDFNLDLLNDKKLKSRKHKRIIPTMGSTEDQIDVLHMTRKPATITNYTKYKNRISKATGLNTSI